VGSVTEIWSVRNLQRGLRRHWVRLGEEMAISGDHPGQYGVLSICRAAASGRLFATLTLDDKQLTEEVTRRGELVISIREIKLVLAVRAVEGARVLVEFGVPHGDRTRIALLGQPVRDRQNDAQHPQH
jgi:hypothetical protein